MKEGFGSTIRFRLQESVLQMGECPTDDRKQKRLGKVRVRSVVEAKGRGRMTIVIILGDISGPSTESPSCRVAALSSLVDRLKSTSGYMKILLVP